MLRRSFLKNVGVFSGLAGVSSNRILAQEGKAPNQIKGKVSDGTKGLAGVSVSDGFTVTQTDKTGVYRLDTDSRARFVFISIPAGFEIPSHNGIASFYKSALVKSTNANFDFVLNKQKTGDHKHAFIVWGDTQILTDEDANLLKTVSAPDTRRTVESLKHLPLHGIGCGDLVFDRFELYDDYRKAVALTGIPFFQVIGNHDLNYESRSDEMSQRTFNSHFGPTYYSFNRGRIHYIVLDNVFFVGTKSYIGYIPEAQLSWLEKDLSTVPAGTTVVLSLHIPTDNGVKRRNNLAKEEMSGITSNRQALYDLLKDYKVHIMSGHTHFNENWEKENIMEHNHGTVCGAWWSGPICSDGTPNGYGVYEVDGDEIKWHYKSVGFDGDHQMVIHRPGAIPDRPDAITVNVWNWDDKWKVEWLEDGIEKGVMKQFTGVDPQAVKLYNGSALPNKHPWVEATRTDHLFEAVPSAQAKKISVRVTDRFGKVYLRDYTA